MTTPALSETIASQDCLVLAVGLASTIARGKGAFSVSWHYEEGLAAMALDVAGVALDRPDLCDLALGAVAALIGPDGEISGYREDEYNLDQINPGKNLFRLLEVSGEGKYESALHALRGQLERQPRCPGGGYWHKKIYPNQMWLDGLYMAQPFLARYAARFGRSADFDEVIRQFSIMEKAATDPSTGLLRHAWDESRSMPWADPATGRSPHAWGRAMGWFMMALVDSYEYYPDAHPGKNALAGIMGRVYRAVLDAQDAESGLWWQVMDQAGRPGNYLEASASAMFCYALAKAARLSVLPRDEALAAARKAMAGIRARLVSVDPDGSTHLESVCAVAGLGGSPYRDGSFEYYVNERRARDDYKGTGPCLLAALELGAVS